MSGDRSSRWSGLLLSSKRQARSRDDLLEMEMMRPEIAAVIAGGDMGDALLGAALGDGVEACAHGRGDRRPWSGRR